MKNKFTSQMKEWDGAFGKKYTDRNTLTLDEFDELVRSDYGVTRSQMNYEFLNMFDRSIKILEVGANIGLQLEFLKKMGFRNLNGIELQEYAVQAAQRRNRDINIACGSALNIPYKDESFDLVFTSDVLIHISPSNINTALQEIYRCAKTYIWGKEYFSEHYTEVQYRGNTDLLWKADFAQLYLDKFSNLETVKRKKFNYVHNSNIDEMFLFKKR